MQNHLEISSKYHFWTRNVRNLSKSFTESLRKVYGKFTEVQDLSRKAHKGPYGPTWTHIWAHKGPYGAQPGPGPNPTGPQPGPGRSHQSGHWANSMSPNNASSSMQARFRLGVSARLCGRMFTNLRFFNARMMHRCCRECWVINMRTVNVTSV